MRGDFTHDRFNKTKHFNRVLKQQGRVDLDADWNEQAAISLHLLRTFITDVVGRAATPRAGDFSVIDWKALSPNDRKVLEALGVKPAVGDFAVAPGRMYVDGILVESEGVTAYGAQKHWSGPLLETGKRYLAYLDVWERHVSWIEDDSIREVALGGPDSCTRVQTVWQIKTRETTPSAGTEAAPAACDAPIEPLRDWRSGRMTARLEPGEISTEPCVLPPESRYRGLENHLYRIEVHRGSDDADKRPPTFKWSRENGSVAARWLGTEGNIVRVSSSRGFEPGQWIELTDDTDELQGVPGVLTLVTLVDGNALTVTGAPAWSATLENPKVRRWDQKANDELTLDEGAIEIVPGSGELGWIEIEHGIEVQFEAGNYRAGDYWTFPARVTTGRIEWPMKGDEWLPQAPRGVEHHYAPLAIIDAVASAPFVDIVSDCRCVFTPLECLGPAKKPIRPIEPVGPIESRPVEPRPFEPARPVEPDRVLQTPEKRVARRGRKKPG